MAEEARWYAVLGQPIQHSRSPDIHRAFAAQAGNRTLRYERIECGPGQLASSLATLRVQGLHGANITLPLKTEAFALCNRVSLRAQRAGAVNTLTAEAEGGWYGDNTDGAGLMQDLIARQGVSICGKRLLLIGAGGAAAGVLPALLDMAPAAVVIVNRSFDRACALAGLHQVDVLRVEELAQAGAFDLLLNASAAGHQQEVIALPASVMDHNGTACDIGYGASALPFLQWAKQAGARRTVDGLGMLVEQAALAYALWHQVRPQTEPVYQHLRTELT